MSEINIREYPEGFRFGANEDIIVSSEVLSAYVEKLVLEAKKETTEYFKKYMISTSPFISQKIDPYLENIEDKLATLNTKKEG